MTRKIPVSNGPVSWGRINHSDNPKERPQLHLPSPETGDRRTQSQDHKPLEVIASFKLRQQTCLRESNQFRSGKIVFDKRDVRRIVQFPKDSSRSRNLDCSNWPSLFEEAKLF